MDRRRKKKISMATPVSSPIDYIYNNADFIHSNTEVGENEVFTGTTPNTRRAMAAITAFASSMSIEE